MTCLGCPLTNEKHVQIRVHELYKNDNRVRLGFQNFGRGGVRSHAKLGRNGIDRLYVPNTVFTNFWVGGVVTSSMIVL